MTRREVWLSGLLVFAVALAVRLWAASSIVFARPEDAAYYVGVAKHLVEGRGLVSDAIWSFQTPPLTFPRPAFEVWLPLPSFLDAIPMLLLGPTLWAAQLASSVVGSIVAVLCWRLALDCVTGDTALSTARIRAVSLGAGLTAAVFLPLVLASAEPDSTAPFAALVLGACLVMARLARANGREPTQVAALIGLGLLIGLAALTRNEAIWLALAWAIVAWGIAGRAVAGRAGAHRRTAWLRLVGIPAVVAIVTFAPWAIRDWLAFGTPLPGQAIANALSLQGSDIFAWQDPPTLARYLAAGPGQLLQLRWTGFGHNLVDVLLLLGTPVAAIGLVALPWTARGPKGTVLRPLVTFAVITFVATTLLFPVATTWGTFLHASGAIDVLLVVSAATGLDRAIDWLRRRRGWREDGFRPLRVPAESACRRRRAPGHHRGPRHHRQPDLVRRDDRPHRHRAAGRERLEREGPRGLLRRDPPRRQHRQRRSLARSRPEPHRSGINLFHPPPHDPFGG
jgi:hypothetical protein